MYVCVIKGLLNHLTDMVILYNVVSHWFITISGEGNTTILVKIAPKFFLLKKAN